MSHYYYSFVRINDIAHLPLYHVISVEIKMHIKSCSLLRLEINCFSCSQTNLIIISLYDNCIGLELPC